MQRGAVLQQVAGDMSRYEEVFQHNVELCPMDGNEGKVNLGILIANIHVDYEADGAQQPTSVSKFAPNFLQPSAPQEVGPYHNPNTQFVYSSYVNTWWAPSLEWQAAAQNAVGADAFYDAVENFENEDGWYDEGTKVFYHHVWGWYCYDKDDVPVQVSDVLWSECSPFVPPAVHLAVALYSQEQQESDPTASSSWTRCLCFQR